MSFQFWNAQPTVLSMARPPPLWCAPRASRKALGADGAVADRWGKDTKAVPAITAAAAAVFDIAMVKFLYTATNKKPSPQFLGPKWLSRKGRNGYHLLGASMFEGFSKNLQWLQRVSSRFNPKKKQQKHWLNV